MNKNIPASLQKIPFLGTGIGFRAPFMVDVVQHATELDFLEITLDHYIDAGAQKLEELAVLQELFTLVPHCLDMSLGSATGLDTKYLEKVAHLIDQINPPYWSEHIAYTRFEETTIGHLAPLPYTHEQLEIFHRNIEHTRKVIPQPLVLENITYQFVLPLNEFTEVEFISKLLNLTDTGLLLDITNLYTNSYNHHYDYKTFLHQLPLERIVQLHFTGGHFDGEWLVDSHSFSTPPEIWDVMDYVCKLAHIKGIILERDGNIPPFEELMQEIRKAQATQKTGKLLS